MWPFRTLFAKQTEHDNPVIAHDTKLIIGAIAKSTPIRTLTKFEKIVFFETLHPFRNKENEELRRNDLISKITNAYAHMMREANPQQTKNVLYSPMSEAILNTAFETIANCAQEELNAAADQVLSLRKTLKEGDYGKMRAEHREASRKLQQETAGLDAA